MLKSRKSKILISILMSIFIFFIVWLLQTNVFGKTSLEEDQEKFKANMSGETSSDNDQEKFKTLSMLRASRSSVSNEAIIGYEEGGSEPEDTNPEAKEIERKDLYGYWDLYDNYHNGKMDDLNEATLKTTNTSVRPGGKNYSFSLNGIPTNRTYTYFKDFIVGFNTKWGSKYYTYTELSNTHITSFNQNSGSGSFEVANEPTSKTATFMVTIPFSYGDRSKVATLDILDDVTIAKTINSNKSVENGEDISYTIKLYNRSPVSRNISITDNNNGLLTGDNCNKSDTYTVPGNRYKRNIW